MNYSWIILIAVVAFFMFQDYNKKMSLRDAVFGKSNRDKYQVILSEKKDFKGAKKPLEKGLEMMMYKIESYADSNSKRNVQIVEEYNSIKLVKPGAILKIILNVGDLKNSINVEMDNDILDFRNFIDSTSQIKNVLKIPNDKNYKISIVVV